MASLDESCRWTVAPDRPEICDRLVAGLGVVPLVARIMAARGIDTVEAGERFLSPSLERDWNDPSAIPGMDAAVERIEEALRGGVSIAVFGDFDVDGITSTCLLTEALRALGARVHPFIPRRFDEGYGISRSALARVIDSCDPDLIITVDNGIACAKEARQLKADGIDLVVTDHHEPGDGVPERIPVVDPKLEPSGPSHELSGAGVALKLAQKLGERFGKPELWRSLTELAALGTVSDMMELTCENRALVAEGIARMRTTRRPGLKALAALTRTDLSCITAEMLSFTLIPRLNAAGRMADPALALDLLLARDPIEAGRLAAQLESINIRRREIESALASAAFDCVERAPQSKRIIVAGGEGWHEGVKGIVASRLVNCYHVPVLLFSIENGIARGSGRSVGTVNLFDALGTCSDMLIRFGGHAGAVGVTLDADRLDELRARLDATLSRLPARAFEDRREISAIVTLSELDIGTVEQISQLEPFGQGNAVPLFAARGVTMTDRACVGRTADHMRFTATDGIASVPAIMFRVPEIERLCACSGVVDLVFQAVPERWQGRVKTKLMVKDILQRAASDCAPAAGASDQNCLEDASRASTASSADPMGPPSSSPSVSGDGLARRQKLSMMSEEELTTTLLHAFIGDAAPHAAQLEALDALATGTSCLTIMGTGRGKSLIFQVHAAREALLHGRASILVYPLRALVADQSFHLASRCAALGLEVGVLTGEIDETNRLAAFSRLASGKLDIVLTTPEFLVIHARRFAVGERVGFVVIDEAHHAGLARGGERSAYLDLPTALRSLNDPTVLATTATAGDEVVSEIRSLLSIERIVIDDSVRSNLRLEDERDLTNRENRLVSLVASGEKCIVYVNSRDRSVSLTRVLRKRIPDLAAAIAFYNAGLTRVDRGRVERAFRDGRLVCIVSTSAFGEGVNLPDVRHIVLYHLPFSAIEFNQMSGRAGRDGRQASIHLLYTARDARINEHLLDAAAPAREQLVALYRALRSLSQRAERADRASGFAASDEKIAALAAGMTREGAIDPRAVGPSLGIFQDLGLVRVTGFEEHRRIEMAQQPRSVELTSSIRYLEGLHARLAFSSFKGWALDAPVRAMLARMNRPITPRPNRT